MSSDKSVTDVPGLDQTATVRERAGSNSFDLDRSGISLARISLSRVGNSLPTKELLSFQLAHAKAKDAVLTPLNCSIFAVYQPLIVQSAAPNRESYLRRPDLGRRLANPDQIQRGDYDIAIILADGLSATAVHRHATPTLDALLPLLEGWKLAPIVVAQQARVALADEIGERLGAKMSLILIGERPGLSAPDSLGAYLTWSPRVGRSDAERNCVSNIREEGLNPALAAHRIAMLMKASRRQEISGVRLRSDPTISATENS